MRKIAIYGAGGFGREVHSLIEQINIKSQIYEFIGYFDDGVSKREIINGFPVLGGISEANNWTNIIELVFAIGDPKTKKHIISQIVNKNISFPVLIHPNVVIGDFKYNIIGAGSIICAGNIITVNIEIGQHVILNLACTTGHDTKIGNYCSFMPTTSISGEVIIEDCVYIGTGTKINNLISIGENTIVGSGAVVSKTLPPNCTAVGIPAKPIKFLNI